MLFILPPQIHGWAIAFELRGRFEVRDNSDFDASADDETTLFLTRGRFNVSYKISDQTTTNLVYQFTTASLDTASGPIANTVGQDLIVANIARRSNGSTLTLGRQKVSLGG